MSLQAINDYVLIRLQDIQQTSDAGIILVLGEVKRTQGVVLSVGSKVQSVRAGETVLVTEYAGRPTDVDGEEVFRDDEILAVIESE